MTYENKQGGKKNRCFPARNSRQNLGIKKANNGGRKNPHLLSTEHKADRVPEQVRFLPKTCLGERLKRGRKSPCEQAEFQLSSSAALTLLKR